MKYSLLAGCIFLGACGGTTADGIDAGGAHDASLDTNDSDGGQGLDGAIPDAGSSDAPTAGDSGGGPCDGGACPMGLTCCGGQCKNLLNDPQNCSQCGQSCSGKTPMCAGGSCSADLCEPKCGSGSVCCAVQGPGPSGPPKCYVGATCPVGCPLCK